MNTASLVKWVRDPRSGEIHLPSEEVTVVSVIRNMDRTLMKVRWQAGGEWFSRKSLRKSVRASDVDENFGERDLKDAKHTDLSSYVH
jgi:hypothetical protein